MSDNGRHSRSLCGPADGRGACTHTQRATATRQHSDTCSTCRCVPGAVHACIAAGCLVVVALRCRRLLACCTYPGAAQLVEHPVLGRIEALHVLLGTARHGCVVLVSAT